MELGKLIRNTRTKANLTQQDFAVKLGLGKGGEVSVSRWERGVVTPNQKTFNKMVDMFDIAGEWNDSGCWIDADGDIHDFNPAQRRPVGRINYNRKVKASENIDHRRKVLKQYAEECQRIYEERTAGDFTWEGVLMSFFDEFA